MSGAPRRLQRWGHPVVGERLDGVQAHYRDSKGNAFTVQVDARSADMTRLYQHLTNVVAEHVDVAEAFAVLDAIASEPPLRKQRLPMNRALEALVHVYWLEYHGHLATDEHNGMLFVFSRPSPDEPGRRVGFMRQTLDPTHGQETAFAHANRRESDGQLVSVLEDLVR